MILIHEVPDLKIDLRSERVWLPLATFALSASLCSGQIKNSPTGTVTGHVYCADTNAPARFASVMLQPVEAVKKEANKDAPAEGEGAKVTVQYQIPDSFEMSVVQTSLDGSFTIEKVKPGTYYVVVNKPGYLSAMVQVPMADRQRITPEAMEKAGNHKITVEANQSVQVEERIERGAALSGTVSFDDGSPAAGLSLQLWRKTKDGTWDSVAVKTDGFMPFQFTDDMGHFRMAGLQAGEYIAQVDMSLSVRTITRTGSSSGEGGSGGPPFTLTMFSGGKTRKKDAVPVKLSAGEERTGEDIVIPLSKLHQVTGSLVSARDGHVINAGEVALIYPDDRTQIASADFAMDKPGFDFRFVPEGDYLLRVNFAVDQDLDEAGLPRSQSGPHPLTQKDFEHYGSKDLPVSIRGDVTGLVVPVPERATTATPSLPETSAGGPQ
ncbi:MAG TPA: carboxypeptidase-like regulatory domain-containing protein [Acidisarcina sp.]